MQPIAIFFSLSVFGSAYLTWVVSPTVQWKCRYWIWVTFKQRHTLVIRGKK